MAFQTKIKLFLCFIVLMTTACAPVQTTIHPFATATPSATPSAIPYTTPPSSPQAVELGVLGKGSARDMAWSQDGKLLAVTSSTGVYLYDTQTWQVVKTISKDTFGDKSVNSVVFSRDGKSLVLLVYKYSASSFWHYDLQSGQAVPWHENLTIDSQTAPVFSPDGKTFAFLNQICENGGQSCITNPELRESDTGKLLYALQPKDPGQESWSTLLAFSPDGKQLAEGSQDNHVLLWDTNTGKLRYEFLHDSIVASLAFSPDGKVLASASKDATVRFSDTQTGKNLFTLRGFKQGIQYVTYHDNGKKLLVSLLYDNATQDYALDDHSLPTDLFDVAMQLGRDLNKYTPADTTTTATIRLNPDTHKMAVLLNETVQVWNAETGQPILTLPGYGSEIHALAFSADGNLLAMADHNVHLWQVSTQKFIATLPINTDEIDQVVFQPNGHQLAVVGIYQNVQIWDTGKRQKLREISDADKSCSDVSLAAFSPDGAKLATAGCSVAVWDAETGQLIQKLTAVDWGSSDGLAFSADGKDLIYVAGRGIWRWNLATGKPVYSTRFPDDHYWTAAMSSNLIALGEGLDGPFHFFDTQTGQHLYDFAEGRGGTAIALHPDGRLFARSDYSKILLADSVSGAKMLSIDFDLPYFISFSPDTKQLAASSYDNTVHLWDISSAAKFVVATIPVTATPDPALIPTPTITPDPIPPLSIQPLTPPTPRLDAIRPETIAQLEKRGEFGLGQADAAAWASDDKTLAVGISTGVYIFELGVDHPTHFLHTDESFVSQAFSLELLAFSPDTRLLAGQMSNSGIQVWDVSTGRRLYKLDDGGCWNDGMMFSPDSQVLSAYCGDVTYRWSMSDGSLLAMDEPKVSSSNTSSDGRLVAQFDMTSAHLANVSSGDIVKTFDVPDMAPAWVKFSPDGKTLLVWFYKYEVARTGMYYSGKDPKSLIQLWNVIPGQLPTLRATFVPGKWLPQYIVTMGAFQGLAFSPDSRRVVTASGDGQAQIWDVKSGKLLAALPDGGKVYFSSDGKRLIAVGNTVQVWDVSPGKQPAALWNIPGFAASASMLTFSGDSKQLVAASAGMFRSWSQSGGSFAEPPIVVEAPDVKTTMLSTSRDGKWLAYSTSTKLVLGENNPKTHNWQTLETFANSAYYLLDTRALTFSPDSTMLAVVDLDRKVLLWTLGQPEPKAVELLSDAYLNALLFSPDSRLLLGSNGFSSEESTLYLWDTTTGKLLRKWKAMGGELAFHPDGVTLAVANDNDGTISLVDLRTWSILREIKGSTYIRNMIFSPDGSMLAVSHDGKIELWDVAASQLVKTLEGNFSHPVFSPDGRFLALSLWDGNIQVWGLPGK